jgi:predicted O-methyltransferase YrrM
MITTTDHEKHQIVNYIRAIGALRVLEIGAFQGETTSVIASAVAEVGGRVVVIDPMKWSSEVLRNGIARHLSTTFPRVLATLERVLDRASYEPAFWRKVGGRERTDIVVYRALSTDPGLLSSTDEALAEFDVVFIDGDHGYEGARSRALGSAREEGRHHSGARRHEPLPRRAARHPRVDDRPRRRGDPPRARQPVCDPRARRAPQ